jgi:hypothetical protein
VTYYHPVRNGVIAAFVVLAVAGVGGYFWLQSRGATSKSQSLERVVVVFASRGEDGSQLAQVVAVVTDDGRSVRFHDPGEKVTIPGTSYTMLRDAYPFGGAKMVAGALTSDASVRTSYVDVPEAVWLRMLEARGPLAMEIPAPIDVFDGERLVSIGEGTATVPAADVPLMLQGASYLKAPGAMSVIEQVGKASLAALGASRDRVGVQTDLSDEAFARLREALKPTP